MHRDAPSALVIIPVGGPSTLAADRSGFGTSGLARSGVLAQNCVGAGERGGGASADDYVLEPCSLSCDNLVET